MGNESSSERFNHGGEAVGVNKDDPTMTASSSSSSLSRQQLNVIVQNKDVAALKKSFSNRKARQSFTRITAANKPSTSNDDAVDNEEDGDNEAVAKFAAQFQSARQKSIDEKHPDENETISRLKQNVQMLEKKCARLEAQNIFVSVQQLDIAARVGAMILSACFMWAYCKCLWWIWDKQFFSSINHLLLSFVNDCTPDTDVNWLVSWMCQIVWKQHSFVCLSFSLPPSLEVVIHSARAALGWISNSVDWSTVLKYSLVPLPYLYNRWTFNSAHRRFEVFCVAFIVIARIKLCQWRERTFCNTTKQDKDTTDSRNIDTDDDEEPIPDYGAQTSSSSWEEAMWDANYEISARFLYLSILRLKGLWTKTAQYMSSRADFVPVPYVRELKKLQDEAPATDFKTVQRLLPRRLRQELFDMDPRPLASASIGQVHVAKRRQRLDNGKIQEKLVVVKVQHPHAQTLLLDDFWSLKVISRIVAWMDPEYAFLEILMGEWAKEARKELDFTMEAENLILANEAVKTLFPNPDSILYTTTTDDDKVNNSKGAVPFRVEIPIPHLDLSNRNVLVMDFCEGVRVDDFRQITNNWGLPRHAIMNAVAQAFAHLMYNCDIFNGDPHPGNILIRPGTVSSKNDGFTLVLLDWGLAKRLPTIKRMAFCQMTYAAATLDFGLMMDAFDTMGLKLKRENVAEDMEGMRFFLRDMAPRETARRRIKAYVKHDVARISKRKRGERIPVESKAYPGEFFFFVRVNELLHGLGSRMNVSMRYLEDVLKPYAQQGLQTLSPLHSRVVESKVDLSQENVSIDVDLTRKVDAKFAELKEQNKLVGAQMCIFNKEGQQIVNTVAGNLGGLRQHLGMKHDALILGFSCTKAIAATLAHIMVQEGYLTYDEPVSHRVWSRFCPTDDPPPGLAKALSSSNDEDEENEARVRQRWDWKRSITLRHILTHTSGLWAAMPPSMTIKSMASCEACIRAFELDENHLELTVLPTQEPGQESQYHFMSFGWLIAGTLCGAYSLRHNKDVTFEQVYEAMLVPRLSRRTLEYGFRPCGGCANQFPMAETTTSDIRASKMIQTRRESLAMGETVSDEDENSMKDVLKSFRGKEFMLDPRIWNCSMALNANVPSAGGRFSAMGLASFYHDIGSLCILDRKTLDMATTIAATETKVQALQGVSIMSNDGTVEARTQLGLGYQLISFHNKNDAAALPPSAFGHAGVGGSIGFHHKESGLSVGLMLNKADGGKETTVEIMRIVADHFNL